MAESFLHKRELLKSGWHEPTYPRSPQADGVPEPPREKPFDEAALIALPDPAGVELAVPGFTEIVAARRSLRKLGGGTMDLGQLSYLLWATAGLEENTEKRQYRTVPSGGGRHPLDTYIYVNTVDGLRAGLYRYVVTRHALVPVPAPEDPDELREQATSALKGQLFGASVALFWAAVPARSEWRYAGEGAKLVALDAGHLAQNGCLAAVALGLGCCVIGAYWQEKADRFLGLDGAEEFTAYAAVYGVPRETAE